MRTESENLAQSRIYAALVVRRYGIDWFHKVLETFPIFNSANSNR